MSKVTELASGQITTTDAVTIELVEAHETPAWSSFDGLPSPPCCIRSGSPLLPNVATGVFAAAVVKLAQIRRDRKL